MDPNFAFAHFSLGATLQASNRTQAAVESYKKAVACKPEYREAWRCLALLQEEVGSHEEALHSYDEAIKLSAESAELFFNRGNLLFSLCRFEAALSSYDRALALRADFTEAHYNRGNALSALGRDDAAIESYKRALALRPDFPEASYNLSRLTLGPTPAMVPPTHVSSLFDSWAENFDTHLYSTLKYRAHEHVALAFQRYAKRDRSTFLIWGVGQECLAPCWLVRSD